ncbi:MAG: hypothetical protein ACOX5G_02760 [Kiritimatiellia bacterium]
MTPWLAALPGYARTSPFDPGYRFYGTGESAHWPVQSNLNVAAALAVLADAPDLEAFRPAMTREAIRACAFDFLRYALATHKSNGRVLATDGRHWGNHWIAVLGLERAAHGINALEPWLTDDDRAMLRNVRLSEAKYILEEYEPVAGMSHTGRNHPESNIWSGAFLYRTAFDIPDAPNREAMLEKAARFMIAGICVPSDERSEVVCGGRKVKDLYVGANFTENYSLDHHGYMNVGYSVICLSNLAMAWYNFRERGQTPPPELLHHAADLWRVLRNFIFPDGRLLRIGGDTRSRYTYCQCYAVPTFIFAADVLGDADAPAFERRWLEQVETEMAYSRDGSCFSRRLAPLMRMSPYYALRLESDHILSLSYGACWRRKFKLPSAVRDAEAAPFAWQDDFHGAVCVRTGRTVRSWVRAGGQGPTGLCVPLHRSDMAEWQGNLSGFAEGNLSSAGASRASVASFDGGFLYAGESEFVETGQIGEGEGEYPIIRVQTAAAALPDGKSLLVIQRGRMIKDATLNCVYSLNALVPNDVFNRFRRAIWTPSKAFGLSGARRKDEIVDTDADRLNIDGCLSLFSLTPEATLKIVRQRDQNIRLRRGFPIPGSLYADRFCLTASRESRRRLAGEVLFDEAYATAADVDAEATAASPGGAFEATSDGLRRAVFAGFDGKAYLLLANFGSAPLAIDHAEAADLATGARRVRTLLEPGAACVLRKP